MSKAPKIRITCVFRHVLDFSSDFGAFFGKKLENFKQQKSDCPLAPDACLLKNETKYEKVNNFCVNNLFLVFFIANHFPYEKYNLREY